MSTATAEKKGSICFFGEIDRTDKGISSQMPAWSFQNQIEMAQESIDQKQRALDGGFVARDNEPEYRELIAKETVRLRAIVESRPKLTTEELDLCAKAFKELRGQIKAALPTYDDEKRNFVRPHDEYRRNKRPCIELKNESTVNMCIANGINVSEKMEITRDDAIRLQTIIGRLIGEDTNIERVRKIK